MQSTALVRMTAAFANAGFDAVAVPEVPTIVRTAGFLYPAAGPRELLLQFERTIFNLQVDLEDSFSSLAAARQRHGGASSSLQPRPCVLLLDRALPDIKAYCPPEIWGTMLSEKRGQGAASGDASAPAAAAASKLAMRKENSTVADADAAASRAAPEDDASVLARYDMIIHLVTAADGAQEYYTLANNAARTEDIACGYDIVCADVATGRSDRDAMAVSIHSRNRAADIPWLLSLPLLRRSFPAAARQLDRAVLDAYAAHSNVVVVPNRGLGIDAKVTEATEAAMAFVRGRVDQVAATFCAAGGAGVAGAGAAGPAGAAEASTHAGAQPPLK